MAVWRPPHDDLVLPRLLADARDVQVESRSALEIPALLLKAQVGSPNSLTGLFQQPTGRAVQSVVDASAELGEVITGGLLSLVSLHAEPAREIALPNGTTVLLKPVVVEGGIIVLSSSWAVSRLPNFAPHDGEIIDLDEFHAVRDLTRLERLLAEWSASLKFVPSYPTLRAVCVVVPEVAERFPDLGDRVRAMASVWCAELDYVVASHNPRDAREHGRFEKLVLSNRYHLLVTMSDPRSKWMWRLAGRFKKANRPHRALPMTSEEDAVEEFASVVAAVTRAMPGRPTEYWGPEAVARVKARICESFTLSDEAWRHLQRNRYPWPERMLEHIERLADVAEAWSMQKAAGTGADERLEEWVRVKFDLKIALHDKGILDKDAYFEFDQQRLCNRPHVKSTTTPTPPNAVASTSESTSALTSEYGGSSLTTSAYTTGRNPACQGRGAGL